MYAFWRIVEFFALCLWTGEEYGVFVLVRVLQMMVCSGRSYAQTWMIRQNTRLTLCIVLRGRTKACVHGMGALVAMCCLSLSLSVCSFSLRVQVFLDPCQGKGFISFPLVQGRGFIYPYLSAIGPTEACQFFIVAVASLLATIPLSLCVANCSCA